MLAHLLNGQPRIARQPSARTALLTAAVMAALATSATAQLQFAELNKRIGLPPQSLRANAVAVGDVDGDGDLDLITGNDGYPDQQNRLYLNDGTGLFTDATASNMPVDNDNTQAVVLGDVDGDGDLDLVIGNLGPQNRLYLNNGHGVFTDATVASMPVDGDQTNALALGDVDGDGDLDLVLGNSGQSKLYLNNGSGAFTDATAAMMPGNNVDTGAVVLGDVDGDGDLDIVLGNGGNYPQDRLYLNNGGVFTDATVGRMPNDVDSAAAMVLGDLDGDGDLDLVIGNGAQQQNRIYLNNGSGVFTDATAACMPVTMNGTAALALGDVDGDGDLDLILFSYPQNRLYLNNGAGIFRSPYPTPPLSGSTTSIALGDVDGDGDLDLVTGYSFYPDQDRLYLNNGSGVFEDVTASRMPINATGTYSLAFGDVDGDGDLDLVIGNGWYTTQQDRLYLNDGHGTFTDVTAAQWPNSSGLTSSVALGDVDGDGDLDLVIGNLTSQIRLYLNDGNGSFTDATAAQLPAVSGSPTALALGDVDGDGDLDLVVGTRGFYGGPVLQFTNNGSGTFTDVSAARMPGIQGIASSVALGDIDGDADLDLVIVWWGRYGRSWEGLYLNNGSGGFTDATSTRMPASGYGYTGQVALGDVDGDGDLDMVLARYVRRGVSWGRYGMQNLVYVNNGAGTFTDATAIRLPVADDTTMSVQLGDLDRDGDLDIVFGGFGERHRVYLNLSRQLDAPVYLRPGRTYTLEAYARYGPPSLVDVALPYLSTTRVSIPLPPLGVLGITPEFALPPFLIPRPAGVGHVDIAVPNLPGLVGATIYAQALLLQYPFHERLTNVTTDVIQ